MIAPVFFCVLLCLALAQAFHGLPRSARGGVALGLFGGGKSKQSAVIKVDGKTIEASTTPCNLRKELQANGIGAWGCVVCKQAAYVLGRAGRASGSRLAAGASLPHSRSLFSNLSILLLSPHISSFSIDRGLPPQGADHGQLWRGGHLRHVCGQGAGRHGQPQSR